MTLTLLLREMSRAIAAGGVLWACGAPGDDRGGPPSAHRERPWAEQSSNPVERLLRRQAASTAEPAPAVLREPGVAPD